MALVIADRVRETSTTTGTGTLTLGGAVSGYRTFSSAIGNTNTCYYTITLGADYEIGVGTISAGQLARTTILKSSNSNNAVTFAAGTKDVFATYPGEKAVDIDVTQTLTNKTLTAPVLASANITTALTLTGAAGTSGQVPTTAGGGAPTWASPAPAANGLVWLSTVTASASATVDIETTFNSTYDSYMLVADSVRLASNGTKFFCRFKLGGSYVTSGSYSYHTQISAAAANTYGAIASTTATQIIIFDNSSTNAEASSDFVMFVSHPSSTSLLKRVNWKGATSRGTTAVEMGVGMGSNTGTGALTGVRFFAETGNITSGTFRLYGIANS